MPADCKFVIPLEGANSAPQMPGLDLTGLYEAGKREGTVKEESDKEICDA